MSQTHDSTLLQAWLSHLGAGHSRVTQLLSQAERESACERILPGILQATRQGEAPDAGAPELAPVRKFIEDLSASFAERGLTPTETATFIFSLKAVLFDANQRELQGDALVSRNAAVGNLIDGLGLISFEAFSHTRERLIKSQAQSIAELATPVIKVWDGIIALPLVGSVDSIRAKDIMEKLLDAVIAHDADIVIIDITGVPVVDTQVANRLMRTVEAVRLLGTRSIITGINPVIAQTLVQLGIDLSQLTTKASLQAGLQQAFRELRITVSQSAGPR